MDKEKQRNVKLEEKHERILSSLKKQHKSLQNPKTLELTNELNRIEQKLFSAQDRYNLK